MAELPDYVEPSRWLFSDDISEEDRITCTGFTPDFKTAKGKQIPVMSFWGKITKLNFDGEIQIAIFNIANYKDLLKAYGKDTTQWLEKTFQPVAKDKKIELVPRG